MGRTKPSTTFEVITPVTTFEVNTPPARHSARTRLKLKAKWRARSPEEREAWREERLKMWANATPEQREAHRRATIEGQRRRREREQEASA